jgi:predicted secreted protein
MKKIYRLIFACLILAISAANLLAGDNANFKFIGFSEDGRFLAFEESGEWDGAGGEYATTYFINVEKNAFAAAPSVYEWGSDAEKESLRQPRLTRYKKSVAANLKKFRIERGNLGKLVAAHLPGDHSFDKPVLRETYYYDKDGKAKNKMVPFYEGESLSPDYDATKIVFTTIEYPVNPPNEEYYELKLNNTATKLKCQQYSGDTGSVAEGIELTVKPNINHGDFPLQILQKDKVIPASRQCPSSYSIEQVWHYDGKIAVFLNYYKRGFEGDDMRYMVVTGKLGN